VTALAVGAVLFLCPVRQIDGNPIDGSQIDENPIDENPLDGSQNVCRHGGVQDVVNLCLPGVQIDDDQQGQPSS